MGELRDKLKSEHVLRRGGMRETEIPFQMTSLMLLLMLFYRGLLDVLSSLWGIVGDPKSYQRSYNVAMHECLNRF